MEIWKDLTGYIGIYQVSSNGRIKSLPRKIVRKNGQVAKVEETTLKPGTDRYGYSFVVLCKNRTKRTTANSGSAIKGRFFDWFLFKYKRGGTSNGDSAYKYKPSNTGNITHGGRL